ncbi:hypothetical protein PG991_006647 [Apiospora marii]|uniref:AB hydrolase-1 domain-containing protein n=1 Tax=Apiospora marii TaxID=335849 RepID=A0ABR1S068_9PEZI
MSAPVLRRSYIRLGPFTRPQRRPGLQRQHQPATTTYRLASKVALPEPYETMTLPDGRTLSWAETGDPYGDPLFYFHGMPGSRLEAFDFEGVARRLGIRFIAPDRPGFGRSTFYSDRVVTDWPHDVQNLAHHLGIDRYAVLGCSGGGPYALACARVIPATTLTGFGLVSSAGPCEASPKRWRVPFDPFDPVETPFPSLSAWIYEQKVGFLVRDTFNAAGRKYWDEMMAREAKQYLRPGEVVPELPPEKKTPEAIAARREWEMRLLVEPIAEGARGLLREAYLLKTPWGFRLEDVKYEPKVRIFHGAKDENVPISMINYMRERLPHYLMKVRANDNHYSIWDYRDDMLTRIMKCL